MEFTIITHITLLGPSKALPLLGLDAKSACMWGLASDLSLSERAQSDLSLLARNNPQQPMHITHVGTPPNIPSIARYTVTVSTLPPPHTLTHIAVRSHATQNTDTGTNVCSGGRVGAERWLRTRSVPRPKTERTKIRSRCRPDVTDISSPDGLDGFIGRLARSAALPATRRL